MKIHRIQAVIIKNIFVTRRTFDRISDVFYWSAIDLIVWGLTGRYFTQLAPPKSHILEFIISGILFWIIVWRGQQEISINLLEDLWNKNLVNMFVSPLTYFEWISAFLILSIVKVFISFVCAALVAWIFYKINVFSYGFTLIPISILLLVNSWWVGFIIAGIILRYGTKIQTLAWSLVSLLAPFSAIYYPVAILPLWAQYIAFLLPTSYLFSALHAVVTKNPVDYMSLVLSMGLSCIYVVFSLYFFKQSFEKVLEKGLVKLY